MASAGALVAGCAQIVGANFDVASESATGGHGGTASTTTSTSGLGGGGSDTGPIVLAMEVNPFDIEVSGDHVYWTAAGASPGTGAVRRIAKDGSGAVEDLAINLTAPNRLLVSNGYVYFSENDATNGAVMRVSTTLPFKVEPVALNYPNPVGLAIDGDTLYFTTFVPGAIQNTSLVYRVKITPAIGLPEAFVQVLGGPAFLAVQGSFLWGTSPPSGLLWQVPLNAPPIANAQAVFPIADVNALFAVPNGVICGQSKSNGSVFFVPGVGQIEVATTQNTVAEVAGDSAFVYWAEFGGGHIWRGGYAGGTPKLVTDAPNANGLTLDDDSIYFTEYANDGAILKIKKPL